MKIAQQAHRMSDFNSMYLPKMNLAKLYTKKITMNAVNKLTVMYSIVHHTLNDLYIRIHAKFARIKVSDDKPMKMKIRHNIVVSCLKN